MGVIDPGLGVILPLDVRLPRFVCKLVKPPTFWFNSPASVSKLGVLDRGALSDIGVGPRLDTGGIPEVKLLMLFMLSPGTTWPLKVTWPVNRFYISLSVKQYSINFFNTCQMYMHQHSFSNTFCKDSWSLFILSFFNIENAKSQIEFGTGFWKKTTKKQRHVRKWFFSLNYNTNNC